MPAIITKNSVANDNFWLVDIIQNETSFRKNCGLFVSFAYNLVEGSRFPYFVLVEMLHKSALILLKQGYIHQLTLITFNWHAGAQVHEIRQSHCVNNREGTIFSLHIYVYLYICIIYVKYIYIYMCVCIYIYIYI